MSSRQRLIEELAGFSSLSVAALTTLSNEQLNDIDLAAQELWIYDRDEREAQGFESEEEALSAAIVSAYECVTR